MCVEKRREAKKPPDPLVGRSGGGERGECEEREGSQGAEEREEIQPLDIPIYAVDPGGCGQLSDCPEKGPEASDNGD